LIQTAGRAARHLNGEVILYADVMTMSIQKFLAVSEYRRKKQVAYNTEHGITPRSVVRAIEEGLGLKRTGDKAASVINDAGGDFDVAETLRELEEEMVTAANNLEFEKAALLRDQIRELKRGTGDGAAQVNYSQSKPRRGRKVPQRNVTAKLRKSMRA
jgi:excinuclease ABC subunit B